MRNHLIPFVLSLISESISEVPDPIRLSLESESARWFKDLLISGGVVALGCLLELWETAVSMRNWRRARRGLEVIENPRSWGIPIAAFGLLLVIGGIVAEVVYEGLSSNVDARLRAHESAVLSVAESNTGLAMKDSAQLRKAAGQLQKDAEGEHLARVQLEKSVEWRTISSGAEKTALAKLSRLPRYNILLITYDQSAETSNFSKQVLKLLSKTGWTIYFDPIMYMGQGEELPSGDCFLPSSSIDVNATGAFQDAMKSVIPDLSRCNRGPRITAGTVIRNGGLPGTPPNDSDLFTLNIGVKAAL